VLRAAARVSVAPSAAEQVLDNADLLTRMQALLAKERPKDALKKELLIVFHPKAYRVSPDGHPPVSKWLIFYTENVQALRALNTPDIPILERVKMGPVAKLGGNDVHGLMFFEFRLQELNAQQRPKDAELLPFVLKNVPLQNGEVKTNESMLDVSELVRTDLELLAVTVNAAMRHDFKLDDLVAKRVRLADSLAQDPLADALVRYTRP
jgi:hypothetical protein